MDASLDELIERKTFSSRGALDGAGQNSNSQSGVSPVQNGGPTRRDRIAARRTIGYNPYTKGALSIRDMYGGPRRQQIESLRTTKIHKIAISNLDFGITSREIQDLFYEFGPLKTANVHYDSFGNSMGTAEVVFNSKNAALKAVRLYNNVPLAGRRMKIEIVLDYSTVSNLATRLSRPALTHNNKKKATIRTICQYRNGSVDGRPIMIDLSIKLLPNSRRTSRHSRIAPMPVRGTRGAGYGFRGNRANTGGVRGNFGVRGGTGDRSIKRKIPSKEQLDAQLDDIIKNKNN